MLIKRMKILYACLIEKNGQENLFGYKVKDTWYPAVFPNIKSLDAAIPTLQKAANERQCNINVVAYGDRKQINRLQPMIIRPQSLVSMDEVLEESQIADELCEETAKDA